MTMKSCKRPTLTIKMFAAALYLTCSGGAMVAAQTHGGVWSVDGFNMFRRPQVMEALSAGDMDSLFADRMPTFLYVAQIVEALETLDVWYRIGMDTEAMLDPQLAPRVRGIVLTDPEVMRFFMAKGLETFSGALIGLTGERQRQIEENIFDPAGEITVMNSALLRGQRDIVLLQADAGMDAKRLMLVARDDPAAFLRIYNGMRSYVYTFGGVP
jgi:hypothetical protein